MNWTVLWAQLKKLDKKIDDMETISLQKVDELPEVGEDNVIYFVPKETTEEGNYSDEYIWDSDLEEYEKIGDTQVSNTPTYYNLTTGIGYVYPGNDGFVKLTLADGVKWGTVLEKAINGEYVVLVSESFNSGKAYITLQYGGYINNTHTMHGILSGPAASQNSNGVSIYLFRMNRNNSDSYTYVRVSYIPYLTCESNSKNKFLKTSSNGTRIEFADALPSVTSSDNGKLLGVSSGVWSKVNPPAVPTDYAKDTSVTALYDSTATYELGDVVMYNKELYECTTAIPVAEEWDSTHWTKTDIFSQMPVIPPIPADANHNIASAYDSTATYNLGDLCIYNGNLYECSTAISTAEAWDSTHWTQKVVADKLGGNEIVIYTATSGKLDNGKTKQNIINDISNGKIVFVKAFSANTYTDFLCCYRNTNVSMISISADPNSSNITYLTRGYFTSNTNFTTESKEWKYIPSNIASNSLLASTEYGSYQWISKNNKLLPSSAVADAGKILMVNSSGNWAAAKPNYAKDSSVAPLYDSTATYSVGDVCMYQNELYVCNTDISVAEAWTASHWTKADILDVIDSKISDAITSVLNTSF